MKRTWLLAVCAALVSMGGQVHAGKYVDAAGLYPAGSKGECKSRKLYGKEFADQNISGVCVPVTTLMNEDMQPLLRLGIIELTNPQQLEAMERLELLRLQPSEAYKVQIDNFSNDIFRLVDGSILEKKGSSYVGYIGYHEKAILYSSTDEWRLCVKGRSHKVNVLKNQKYHYSRSSFSASIADIEKMEECK